MNCPDARGNVVVDDGYFTSFGSVEAGSSRPELNRIHKSPSPFIESSPSVRKKTKGTRQVSSEIRTLRETSKTYSQTIHICQGYGPRVRFLQRQFFFSLSFGAEFDTTGAMSYDTAMR